MVRAPSNGPCLSDQPLAVQRGIRGHIYAAKVADGKSPVTKERVAAKLSEFTDEELAEMGLSRKKSRK